MHDLRAMGETNALIDRHRKPARKSCSRARPDLRRTLPDEEGRIRATFEVIFLTGWAPHDSQQKPLRPGSAKARLAEALNATHVEDNTAAALDRADD
jgi:hypothetical protein